MNANGVQGGQGRDDDDVEATGWPVLGVWLACALLWALALLAIEWSRT